MRSSPSKGRRHAAQRGQQGFKPSILETPCGPMTRKHAAILFGIPLNTLHGRLHRTNLPPEAMFDPPYTKMERCKVNKKRWEPPSWLTAWGKETIAQAAARMKMSEHGLYGRLRVPRLNGLVWQPHEAFNTPPHGTRGVHFIIPPDEYHRRVVEHRDAANKRALEGDA